MGITDQVSQRFGFLLAPPASPEAVRAVGLRLRKRREPVLIGRLVRTLYHGKTLELRLAAVEALSHHPDDQVALHHAAFHDPDLTVRIAAAQKITRDDLEPLTAMSDDEEVRFAFVRNTRLKDVLVAMELCDSAEAVKTAAAEALVSRAEQLESIRNDTRTAAYYLKFRP